MQDVALQVNRPHGWGFQKITNGEIRYMKLWQVSVDGNGLHLGDTYLSPSLARGWEF